MRHIKALSPTLSALCFLIMLGGIETSLWYGLLVIPAWALMYIGGGCYEIFYKKRSKKR